MKKILLPLIALISFAYANAQSKEKGTFEITPKIGYSIFNENNENNNTHSISAVSFGATADYYFNNRWSLRSGLSFDKMGGTYDAGEGTLEDKLNYLSIPLNANWHFGSTRKWNLNFGFSPSFLLNAEVSDTAGHSMEIPSSIIESFQLGFTYGIGYKIEVNEKFGILLDWQGFAGLTNINKANSSDIKNSGSSFNVGGVIQL
ncbi:porin family protein [Flavobacterium taihuense]|uniref:PorT family protein n=1 Tax=Flavobacterium taihuense TaxID=2857508 RepID=A0ABS6XQF9_9FLAO|nr:porin family protein [Flavobacterium taihuense]MBW4358913.1 PorT family protein [Flavobacterium taihuense]